MPSTATNNNSEQKQRITPRALLDVKVPQSPAVSPDGSRVVFCVSEPDYEESRWVSRLWLADIPEGSARRITHSYEGERCPRWSPDGRWLAFLSTRPDMTEPPPESEDEEDLHKEQLWIMPAEGGEAYRLSSTAEGVREYRWSPDSETVVYLCPEARPHPLEHVRDDRRKRKFDPVVEREDRRRMQFWEIDLQEKKPELLYTGDKGIAEFDLSPDGERILYNTNYSGDPNDYHRYDLFVLTIESGDNVHVAPREGGQFHPHWSPDGKQFAFVAAQDPLVPFSQACLWIADEAGPEPQNLFADEPWDLEEYHWPRAGGGILASVADRTTTPLVRWSPDGGTAWIRNVPGEQCLEFNADVTDRLVAVLESSTALPELYLLADGSEPVQLTELNRGWLERYALPRQEVVRWESDGRDVEGLLTYPNETQTGPFPLLVQVHGGPKGRATESLRSYYLHPAWAAEGYLVFQPNFRGSEGYGNDFAVATRGDLGGGDFRDIMAGIDSLIAVGLADGQRLGILGGSYGGYMANWAISQTGRFAAAVSMFGIFNLVTDYGNSDIARWDPDYLGAYYWEDLDAYRRSSPSTFLERIETPVLIMHGDSDRNTHIANSQEMYRALLDRGVTVEFVRYPREGHGLHEPNHRLDEVRRALAWMDRYLCPARLARRVGDRILFEGYTLEVTRAEDAEYHGWHEDWGRLLEVEFSMASDDPVDEAWRLELSEVRLRTAAGDECPLRGVPVDLGGGRTLVSGDRLGADLHPDRDSGRLSVALAAAFEIPEAGGDLEFQIVDFPPVRIAAGPRPPRERHEASTAGDELASEPLTGAPAPQRINAGDPRVSAYHYASKAVSDLRKGEPAR